MRCLGCSGSEDEVPGMLQEQGRGAWDAPGVGTGHLGPCIGGQEERGGSASSSPLWVMLLRGCRSQHRLQLSWFCLLSF